MQMGWSGCGRHPDLPHVLCVTLCWLCLLSRFRELSS